MYDDRIRAGFDESSYERKRFRIAMPAVWQAITPLRMIFWGGLLCVFDVTVSEVRNGQGFKFDFLNDAVGALLIAIGVARLSAIRVHRDYGMAMKFVLVVAILSVLDAIREHFVMPLPEVVSMALLVFGLVSLVAIVTFCVAMRWFCEAARIGDAARSWNATTWLFVLIYLLPLGFFHLAGLAALAGGTSFHINLGPAGLLLLPLFAVPLIHLFVSTSRMIRQATLYVPPSDDDATEDGDDFQFSPRTSVDELRSFRRSRSAGWAWLWLLLGSAVVLVAGWVWLAHGK